MNKKAVIGLGSVVLVFLCGIGYVNIHHASNKQSEVIKNAKSHVATNYLNEYSLKRGLNVTFYDNNSNFDFNVLLARLKTGDIEGVTLLMYSDNCPICVKEKSKLAKWLDDNASNKSPVIAINNARDAKGLSKYFQLPNYYHYPSVFSYTNEVADNAKQRPLILKSQKLLRNL